MTHYYGFMVCILTGDVDLLEGEHKYKPEHEDCGFGSYVKWYTSEYERNTMVQYTIDEISKIRRGD